MSGIFAIYNPKEQPIFEDLFFGLYALQHRGQASVGIAVQGQRTQLKVGHGLMKDTFREADFLSFPGSRGIGFIDNNEAHLEMPIVLDEGILAIDGVIKNEDFSMLDLLVRLRDSTDDLIPYIETLEGAFSICYVTPTKLIAIRDEAGIKPLCLGWHNDSIIISSESCAIDVINGTFERDLNPGEILIYEHNQLQSFNQSQEEANLCAFELIYFARQDSLIDGVPIYNARYKMGQQLWHEAPMFQEELENAIVIGAPDSGIIAAMGYAKASNIPYQQGFVRNRYVGRTFSKERARDRQTGVKIKLTPIKHNLQGKDVFLIDDSIIRGTTITKTVQNIRNAGAKTVHVRIAAPPVVNQSKESGSINVPADEDLIAQGASIAEIQAIIGSDSLQFLSLEGLRKACRKNNIYDPYFIE